MADKPAQDKTEAPSPRRREKAREEGDVARSAELSSVSVLLAGFIVLSVCAGNVMGLLPKFMVTTYGDVAQITITADSLPQQVGLVGKLLLSILAPLFVAVLVAGIVANCAQIGLIFAGKALLPKLDRLNPVKGLQRIFSLRSLMELLKGIGKIFIVGLIGYLVLKSHIIDFWTLPNVSTADTIHLIGGIALDLTGKIGLTLLVLALADYCYQRWEHEKKLKMTREEVKEELKQYEGSPETKARVRSIQRQLSRRRMMAAVPDATVVVTNPVFIAVALKYEPVDKDDAPVVVAKGKRKLAQRIKATALEHGVPVMEDRALARELYQLAEVGVEIPMVLYHAVAEILARVYRLNRDRYAYMNG